jgi:hypothetical protein
VRSGDQVSRLASSFNRAEGSHGGAVEPMEFGIDAMDLMILGRTEPRSSSSVTARKTIWGLPPAYPVRSFTGEADAMVCNKAAVRTNTLTV